jgi:peroxiredoxin
MPVKSRLKKWAVEVLVFVIVVAGIRAWQQRDMVSGIAPPLQGITLAGMRYKLPTQKPVLVHFWATWCPICRTEQGAIQAIAHDHPQVITVAMQSGTAIEVTRFMQQQGLSFPALNDSDGSISHAWGVNAVPASFIISPDGKIRFVEVGYTTGIGLRFRLWLAGL